MCNFFSSSATCSGKLLHIPALIGGTTVILSLKNYLCALESYSWLPLAHYCEKGWLPAGYADWGSFPSGSLATTPCVGYDWTAAPFDSREPANRLLCHHLCS